MKDFPRMTSARQLNDDSVVLLLLTIFEYTDGFDRRDDLDVMERIFGGGVHSGNSHNGAYQLGKEMSRQTLHRYTGL